MPAVDVTESTVTGPFSPKPGCAVTAQPRAHNASAMPGVSLTTVTPIQPGVSR